MQTKHILPLTGLRFFAATWVVSFHFQYLLYLLFPFLSPWLSPFSNLGYHAVSLFFILSGFILSHNYFASYSLSRHPQFIFLRFARVWPVHCLTLLFLVMGQDAFPLGQNVYTLKGDILKAFLEELFMVRYWLPVFIRQHWRPAPFLWNAPAWTLSVEWFAYIVLFPLAFIFFKRIRSWRMLAVLITLFLILQSCLPMVKYCGDCGTIYFFFLAGSALYQIHSLVKNPPAEAIVVGGLLLFVAYVLLNKWLPVCVLYAAFVLLIFGLSWERGFLSRLLSTKLVVAGGLASYSLYMTHFLVRRSYLLFFWQRVPESMLLRVLIFLVTVGALAGLALLTYHYVEVPANRLLRRFAQRLQPQVDVK
jgi:peptidoglycan/LPS O-acetylase OafA/YrhL